MKTLLLSCVLLASLISCAQVPASTKIENLQAFAKLYGYVRYFHPSDEADALNWNGFAIYGSQKVMSASNESELLQSLRELFQPIAPAVRIFHKNEGGGFSVSDIRPPDTTGYKPIAWQHKGVGFGESSLYKSMRVNKPAKSPSTANAFAPMSQWVDGKLLAGKKVKVRAWLKLEQFEGDGAGQLWLRVDKTDGAGFFYNMSDRPATSSEWKQYEFEGQIDSTAKSVIVGAILKGPGILYFDNMELLEYKNNEWVPFPLNNASFESDDMKLTGWSPERPQNVAATAAKGYSFLISKNESRDGSRSAMIVSAEMDNMRNSLKKNIPAPLFEGYPIPGEFVRKPIGSNLEVIVPISLYGNESSTYPMAETNRFMDLKKNSIKAARENNSVTDVSVRMADIVIAWNIFRHFFPYWEDADKKPDEILQLALEKALEDKTLSDFRNTLLLMTEPLNDGHIWVSYTGDSSEYYTIPVLVTYAENKLVVEKVFDQTVSEIRKGDIISTVNGVDALQVLADRKKYISGSEQWKNDVASTAFFHGPRNSEVNLVIRRNGALVNVSLKRNQRNNATYANKDERTKSGFISNGIYYVDLNDLTMDSIKKRKDDILSANAVIFDLRGYPKGNHEIISWIMNEPDNTKWMFVPQITSPDYENVSYEELGWGAKPDGKNKVKGKVVFITDGRAISYAESFMGHIKDLKLATIVGGPTAGTNGNVNPFNLPGGFRISWTGMLVKNHDGSHHHIKGVVPDVPWQRTVKGIAEGRDELLEKAIEVVSQ